MSDATQILKAVEKGELPAERLLPLIYEELRKLAAQKMANERPDHTLQPTALVHEAWLRLVKNRNSEWQGRTHFFAAAAEAMRRILIEHARHRSRQKRGGDKERVELNDLDIAAPGSDEDLLALDEALRTLESQEPDLAKVVKLKYFVGMTEKEVAEALATSERTVQRRWSFAKAWLFKAMRTQG